MKVVHLSSVHDRLDSRIYVKECSSLAGLGYDVSLIIADGKGDELREGINIYDVGLQNNRIARMVLTVKSILHEAKIVDADIYHLHDPELLPIGLKLKARGKIVIFDAHEDVSKQLLNKPYFNKYLLKIIARIYSFYERYACRKLDAIVTATPTIQENFSRLDCRAITISNFPIVRGISSDEKIGGKEKIVSYIGGLSEIRGLKEIVQAMEYVQTNTRLTLAGKFYPISIKSEVANFSGWAKVEDLGWLNRSDVLDLLGRSIAGLVTLHPRENYIDSYPIKMFEYMEAGIPVIASNFPLWREIVEGNNCGICIDPFEPTEIAGAIDYLVNNSDIAMEMGENGKNAVVTKYNWETEKIKLAKLYESFFN